MAELLTAPLPRDDISRYISSNVRVIRYFESLQADVVQNLPETIEDNNAAAAAAQATANLALANANAALARQAFPVGAVFVTIDATNPASVLGYGTWAAFGSGRVLVGVDPSDPDFNPVEKTGGSKTATFA